MYSHVVSCCFVFFRLSQRPLFSPICTNMAPKRLPGAPTLFLLILLLILLCYSSRVEGSAALKVLHKNNYCFNYVTVKQTINLQRGRGVIAFK